MNYFRCGGGRSTHTATKIDVAKTPLATFESNVSGLYLPEILAYIQASQSGTGDPSPINPRAINGVSEVTTACNAINQWDEEWELGSFDSTGNPISSTTSIRSKNYIPVKPSTSYYFLFNNSNSAKLYIVQYNARKEFISYLPYTTGITSPRAYTTASDCSFIKLDFSSAYGTTYLNDCSINYPSTDTTYHAYTGTTATTALGGTYYGGYVNVTTGLLTIDQVKEIKKWSVYVATSTIGTYTRRTIALSNLVDNSRSIEMCSVAPYLEQYASDTHHFYCANSAGANPAGRLYLFLDENTLPQDFDEFEVTYPLATPQTYQLTPAQIEQLLGQNNVFCSTGDVAVKYWKID